MTALKMTVDEALALADQWCAGLTMDADSKGWGAILLVLAEEVRRLRADAARWRALREMDGGEIYALLGDCDGIHPDQADAAIDKAMEASNAG